jgi:hypothetical protein
MGTLTQRFAKGNIVIRILLLLAVTLATLGMVRAKVVWTEWTAPTKNTDGTPLTDLAGYNIYISIPAPSSTPTGISNHPLLTVEPTYTKWPFWIGINDAYYVEISAVNKQGVESAKTNRILIKGEP